MFGLEVQQAKQATRPSILDNKPIYLVNARSAIWLLIKKLQPKHVWMPSYLCHSMTIAAEHAGACICYYPVDEHLKVRHEDWLKKLIPGDLVFLIDYFGFPFDKNICSIIHQSGAWVVEDASQAFLTKTAGIFSDFAIFSPRKFVGVPDGGLLLNNVAVHLLNDQELSEPPAEWWLKSFHASVLRRDFDMGLDNREWFTLFRETEPAAPIGSFKMSDFSRVVLERNINYQEVASRRRDNYLALSQDLGDFALFPDLDADTVPVGFPVCTRNRSHILESLYREEIFPPVHWPLSGVVPEVFSDSHNLSLEIMTLPCDQRCTFYDLDRMINLFLKVVK